MDLLAGAGSIIETVITDIGLLLSPVQRMAAVLAALSEKRGAPAAEEAAPAA